MHRTAEEIESLLRDRGFSLTPQRRAIVRRLTERGGHWTAGELLDCVTGEFPMASRATVYSTLALLREQGVLAAVPAPGGELRFDADPEPHQHFLCIQCGHLEDVPTSWFPVALPDGAASHFQIQRFRIIAEGLCAGCATAPNAAIA
jgi:Fur family peroxide stress response transcriptional regulator